MAVVTPGTGVMYALGVGLARSARASMVAPIRCTLGPALTDIGRGPEPNANLPIRPGEPNAVRAVSAIHPRARQRSALG
jgi:hypothetical protein